MFSIILLFKYFRILWNNFPLSKRFSILAVKIDGHFQTGTKQLRYLNESVGDLRFLPETLSMMKEAYETKETVFGVKGISPLVKIPHFGLTLSSPVDYMHCICLGVVKLLMDIWLDSKNNRMKFYLGLKLKFIDEQLLKIHPYSEISRYFFYY